MSTAFIQAIVATSEVYPLSGPDGLAMSSSDEQEDRDVIPFWSTEAGAKSAATGDWAHFKPVAMPLAELMELWLVRMHNEETLAGIDLDGELAGTEIEPLILALDIVKELEASGRAISFTCFKGLADYKAQIREASGL
jgi:hypothetical protein